MLCNVLNLLEEKFFLALFVAAMISMVALGAALFSEVALGLEPCVLCIYQRIPFAVVVVLGVIGAVWRDRRGLVIGLTGVSGLAFLINSGIAFYHTGVEQKWWVSAVEGCAVPSFGDTPQSILENILSAPTARCDEIPWVDPVLGLSMANYNVVLCLGLGVVLIGFCCVFKRRLPA